MAALLCPPTIDCTRSTCALTSSTKRGSCLKGYPSSWRRTRAATGPAGGSNQGCLTRASTSLDAQTCVCMHAVWACMCRVFVSVTVISSSSTARTVSWLTTAFYECAALRLVSCSQGDDALLARLVPDRARVQLHLCICQLRA